MKFNTVEEVYGANDAVRARLLSTVDGIEDEAANQTSLDGSWNVAQILEHVSMVDEGIVRICSKLLSKAEADGLPNDGSVSISAAFMQNTAKAVEEKLKAPDIVEPRAGNTIKDSIANLEINDAVLKELRQKFESIDGTEHKFPHPYFGDLSAQEWLVLRGGHEMRHIRQIVRMINA